MAKLSILLPSRDERFLLPTIHDIFRNARGETEVIAVIDSNLWPAGWKEITEQYPNLHTVFHGESRGMRAAINSGAASAISRGARYIAKFDAHCSFSEGFDEALKADCDADWIVVPRRGRLDPEAWVETELSKPPIDYHYLSFPDDPSDFGGPGLNGKVWDARAKERAGYDLDEEMSSQGSGWFMYADYFTRLGLMNEADYGKFWCEFQELGLQCWLSGGRVMVNKKAKYLHLHKGRKYGRGYRLEESQLVKARNHTMKWPWNEAWPKQTLPFEWLIDHFWPVPSWPENWREVLYATRKPRDVVGMAGTSNAVLVDGSGSRAGTQLVIYSAYYGIGPYVGQCVDVTERLRSLVKDGSLDIVVNNSTLVPDQNPFRGKKKHLMVVYSIDKAEDIKCRVDEKDWLIIGPVGERFAAPPKSRVGGGDVLTKLRCVQCGLLTDSLMAPVAETDEGVCSETCADKWRVERDSNVKATVEGSSEEIKVRVPVPGGTREGDMVIATVKPLDEAVEGEVPNLWPKSISHPPQTPAALNDFLIRKFSISPQRLRGPMPIELRDFHRDDLAQLFAELGFKRGAEIGVAEGKYSEVLLKANPECELLLVDPWHAYSENPQNKTGDKHRFAYEETLRRIAPYRGASTAMKTSMEAVREIARNLPEHLLDFVYIDGNHLFDYVIQDLVEWSKRVRSGGIVSGDDYYALDQKRWVGGGVVEAVQAYTNAHRIPVWYLFAGHKSVDYMWVKP